MVKFGEIPTSPNPPTEEGGEEDPTGQTTKEEKEKEKEKEKKKPHPFWLAMSASLATPYARAHAGMADAVPGGVSPLALISRGIT